MATFAESFEEYRRKRQAGGEVNMSGVNAASRFADGFDAYRKSRNQETPAVDIQAAFDSGGLVGEPTGLTDFGGFPAPVPQTQTKPLIFNPRFGGQQDTGLIDQFGNPFTPPQMAPPIPIEELYLPEDARPTILQKEDEEKNILRKTVDTLLELVKENQRQGRARLDELSGGNFESAIEGFQRRQAAEETKFQEREAIAAPLREKIRTGQPLTEEEQTLVDELSRQRVEEVANLVTGFAGLETGAVNIAKGIERKVLAEIAASKDVGIIKQLLSKGGVLIDEAGGWLERLVKSNKPGKVKAILETAESSGALRAIPGAAEEASKLSTQALIDETLVGKRATATAPSAPPMIPVADQIEKEAKDLADEILGALKKAEPLQQDVAAAQSAERARRAGAFGKAFQEGGYSREAYESAKKSTLAGELVPEPPAFTPLEQSGLLTEGQIERAFKAIGESPFLQQYEKINTIEAFKKLLAGEIPQQAELSLLEDVFGPNMINEILAKQKAGIRLYDAALDLISIPKSTISALDMSAPFRQGLIQSIRHPIKALKSLGFAIESTFRPEVFEAYFNDLKKDPFYNLMKESGIETASPNRASARTVGSIKQRLTGNASGLSNREDAFISRLGGETAEKIPVVGQIVKAIRIPYKASERAYSGYLAKLRVDVFKGLAKDFMATGLDPKKDKAIFEALGNMVNVTTGKGNLGVLGRIAPELNAVFFSPRLMASRLTLLNPYWYIKQPAPVRKEAIKSMLATIGAGSTVLGLAHAAGADVELDPRSSDFGKIRVGKHRWDVWGGLQQYIAFFMRMASGKIKTAAGDVMHLDKDVYPYTTRGDLAIRFARGKLSPTFSTGADLLFQESVIGEENEPIEMMWNKILPLYIQDIQDAVEDEGWASGVAVGAPAFLGVGVQTYEPGNIEKAKNELTAMSKMTQQEANARLAEIAKEDEDLAKAIKARYKEYRLDINDEERFLKELPVERRAREVLDELRDIEDLKERDAKYILWAQKGIITKETQQEMQKIVAEEKLEK